MAIFALPTAASLASSIGKSVSSIGISALNSLLSKNGVSPDFFSKFKWLSFLDNSTSQWKSRLPTLRTYTPQERISFYIDKMMRNGPFHGSCVQYAELFGTSYDAKSGLDDRGKVPVELLELFNSLADEKYFKGKESAVDGWTYYRSGILNRLDIAPDYLQVLQQRETASRNNQQTIKPTPEGTEKNNTMLYVGIGVALAIVAFILISQRKKS
jgi:hypothetical protein